MKRAVLGAAFAALAGMSSVHADSLTTGNANSAKSDALRGAGMRPAPTPNMAGTPIAFGYIDTSGAVLSGSGNFTASYDSGTNTYTIAINGVGYYYSWYSTVITSSEPTPSVCTTDSFSGNLMIHCYTLRGARTSAHFGFIVY